MSLYSEYVQALLTAADASARSRGYYLKLIVEISTGHITVGQDYGGLKVQAIWEGKPVAWRPRPVNEYTVTGADISPELLQATEPQLQETTPVALLTSYQQSCLNETEAWARSSACYMALIEAFLRNELPPEDAGRIQPSPAKETGFAKITGQIRVYEVKSFGATSKTKIKK